MKKLAFFYRSVVNTFVVVWTMLFASGAAIEAAELKVGDDAPPFSLKGSDGKTYSLKDYAGKQAVVLAWFPKAFTGGCTRECKNFQSEGSAIKKLDAAYFTASVDTPEENTRFAKSLGVKDSRSGQGLRSGDEGKRGRRPLDVLHQQRREDRGDRQVRQGGYKRERRGREAQGTGRAGEIGVGPANAWVAYARHCDQSLSSIARSHDDSHCHSEPGRRKNHVVGFQDSAPQGE
jgi:hypothetical protein